MSADGLAAAQHMMNAGTWRPGHCLEAVWQAYKAAGARTDREAPTAAIGWDLSDLKHPGDRNPPPGVPVWWGPRPGSDAGDVVISIGGSQVVATDWPYNGVIGVTTIDARENQIRRPYLGWTADILGAPITYPGSTPPTPPATPQPTGGSMFLAYDADAGRAPADRQLIVVTVDAGQIRGRYLEDPYERAVFVAAQPPLPVAQCDAPTFAGFLDRIGYTYRGGIPLLKVEAVKA